MGQESNYYLLPNFQRAKWTIKVRAFLNAAFVLCGCFSLATGNLSRRAVDWRWQLLLNDGLQFPRKQCFDTRAQSALGKPQNFSPADRADRRGFSSTQKIPALAKEARTGHPQKL